MSLTFVAKSSANSWKMSFEGQVLCQRMVIGPCALTMLGAATVAAAATAAPLQRVPVHGFETPILAYAAMSSGPI